MKSINHIPDFENQISESGKRGLAVGVGDPDYLFFQIGSTSTMTTKSETDKSMSNGGSTAAANEPEPEARHIKKLFTETKVEGGKSVWATTLETMGMYEGKKHKDDIHCETFDEAMNSLREIVVEQQWDFSLTPLKDFNATRDDLLKAFVLWSRSSNSKKDDGDSYNVSKAFRRMQAYVEWMDKNCKDVNLEADESMKHIAEVWKIEITHDKEGRFVWWLDVGALDLQYIKTQLPHEDTLRYFVWLCHLAMFDAGTQEKGMVMVEAMGHKGLIECMTAIPMDLGTKLDRLTIGTLPVRMEAMFLYNNPRWMRIMMALMSPFISSKMKKRIKMISAKKDPQAILEEALGSDAIPVGIANLNGKVEKDIIAQYFEKM